VRGAEIGADGVDGEERKCLKGFETNAKSGEVRAFITALRDPSIVFSRKKGIMAKANLGWKTWQKEGPPKVLKGKEKGIAKRTVKTWKGRGKSKI